MTGGLSARRNRGGRGSEESSPTPGGSRLPRLRLRRSDSRPAAPRGSAAGPQLGWPSGVRPTWPCYHESQKALVGLRLIRPLWGPGRLVVGGLDTLWGSTEPELWPCRPECWWSLAWICWDSSDQNRREHHTDQFE